MKKRMMSIVVCVALLLTSVMSMTALAQEDNYAISDSMLCVGTAAYATDAAYAYTVYGFSPEEEGEYTISCDDAMVGLVSYTDMWVQYPPTAENVNAFSFVWTCTAVGQGIYVAVENKTATVTLTVSKQDMEQEEEVPCTYYENTVTPAAFTLSGNREELLSVDTADEHVDTAVFGADGYYHLNSANGPVLYARLNDPKLSFADAYEYGQLKEVLADENGKVISHTDFNEAFHAYNSCADGGIYPLTADLITMYTRIGAYHGWYGEGGFVGGTQEDAWMFACVYFEEAQAPLLGDLSGDGALGISDALHLFHAYNGVKSLTEAQQAVADLNGDGATTLADVVILFYLVNGN